MNFGEKLKAARERLRVSLDDAAQATKISRRYLVALECEQLDALPAGVFRHGFLRAYAEYLKLDPKPLLREMDALLQPETQEVIVTEPSARRSWFKLPIR